MRDRDGFALNGTLATVHNMPQLVYLSTLRSTYLLLYRPTYLPAYTDRRTRRPIYRPSNIPTRRCPCTDLLSSMVKRSRTAGGRTRKSPVRGTATRAYSNRTSTASCVLGGASTTDREYSSSPQDFLLSAVLRFVPSTCTRDR